MVAQYLSGSGAEAVFERLFIFRAFVFQTAFFGFSKLSCLLFGIFAALCLSKRFVGLYFFAFSLVVYLIVHVLLFDVCAFVLSALFSVVLIFFSLCSALFAGQKRKAALFVVPQVIVGVFLLFLSVFNVF